MFRSDQAKISSTGQGTGREVHDREMGDVAVGEHHLVDALIADERL
jgi:hypothetical protein